MAKACRKLPGDDAETLAAIEARMELFYLQAHFFPGRHRRSLLEAVADRSQDWRLRRVAAIALQWSPSEEVVGPLTSVLLDKSERPEVRAGAGLGLSAVVSKSTEARAALLAVVADSDTPRAVLGLAMMSVVESGTTELDLMMKTADLPAGSLSDLGANFGAIRTIAASPDPRSAELLLKLLEKFPPNSLLRGVTFDELDRVATFDPERLKGVRPRLAKTLLAMTYEERYGGGGLNALLTLMADVPDPSYTDRLIELLEDPKQDSVILARTSTALAAIGDVKALPHLQKLWDGMPRDRRLDADYEYVRKKCPKHLEEPYVPQRCTNLRIQDIREALEKLKEAARGKAP